jgi:tetratricopeptide (TPR) repeat protein
MSVDQARQPAWFSEGIAEVFSTFERGVDSVNWAKPIGAHLQLLRTTRPEPLARLLVEPGALFDRDDRTDLFYAESWAFTHFLLVSENGARRAQLLKFLKMYKTESGEATVAAVFGPDLKDLERDFHIYIDQRSFLYMTYPFRPAPNPPALQPAPADLVEASLGFLALGAERYDLAQQHAEKAIALDSKSPEGQRILAYLALENHDTAEAVKHAEAAIDFGAKDSEMYVLLGDSYANGANSRMPDAAKARANQYENAINLNPHQLAYYERLSEALFALGKPRDEDEQFLNIGLKLFPGADWVRVGTAAVDFRLGRSEAAMATLDTVLRPQSTLDPSQRSYVAKLRVNWAMQAMSSQIQDAVSKNDFAGARALVGQARERVGDDSDATSYLDQITRGLEVSELLARYTAARQANHKAEARALAEQLLARPGLPGNLRSSLEKQLSGAATAAR